MRHLWGAATRAEHTTDRTCSRCGLVRRTRYEPTAHPWVEWFRDGNRVKADKTPLCDAAEEEKWDV